MTDHYKKVIFFLPNLFTALNMSCGYAAIYFALKGEIYKACMLLALGAVFDLVDGKLARITGTESTFGEQFDSMSDLITFGMAPSLIFYTRFLEGFGRVGMIASFLFLICGALRLARFNANIDKVDSNYFQGIPIPGAAMALVGWILLSLETDFIIQNKHISLMYIMTYALLMISTIPFPSFKKSEWVKNHKKQVLLIMFGTIGLFFIYEEIMLVILITLYVLASMLYYFFNRAKFKELVKKESS